MPNPLKRLPSGRHLPRLPFRNDVQTPRYTSPPASTYSYAGPSPNESRLAFRDWSWWEWILFVPALIVHGLAIVVPWAQSKGILKLFVTFMVIWAVFGMIATKLDTAAGEGGRPTAAELENKDFAFMGSLIIRECPREAYDNTSAGFPLGRLYIGGTTCAAWLSHTVLDELGLDFLARKITPMIYEIRFEYFETGTYSISYLWLGAIFFWTVATLPIWLVLVVGKALVMNLNISWG